MPGLSSHDDKQRWPCISRDTPPAGHDSLLVTPPAKHRVISGSHDGRIDELESLQSGRDGRVPGPNRIRALFARLGGPAMVFGDATGRESGNQLPDSILPTATDGSRRLQPVTAAQLRGSRFCRHVAPASLEGTANRSRRDTIGHPFPAAGAEFYPTEEDP